MGMCTMIRSKWITGNILKTTSPGTLHINELDIYYSVIGFVIGLLIVVVVMGQAIVSCEQDIRIAQAHFTAH